MQIRTTLNKGIRIHIGEYVISAQWGYGNYCKNQDTTKLLDSLDEKRKEEAPLTPDCEVAVWRTDVDDNVWICTDGSNSQVWGWVDIDTVFELAVHLEQQLLLDDKLVREAICRFIESRG